jgi:hypothetical protein
MQAVIKEIEEFRLDLDIKEIPKNIIFCIQHLWVDSGIQTVFDRLQQAAYFIDSAP